MRGGEDDRITAMRSLPTEHDFDPYGGDLDAQCAWKHFGCLTLEEAHRKFRTNPDYYQEDFMFMGGKAFAFYYPVIENFLRESTDGRECVAWILARVIKYQFDHNLPNVIHLTSSIFGLAHFVRENVNVFDPTPKPKFDVDVAWRELEECLKKITEK